MDLPPNDECSLCFYENLCDTADDKYQCAATKCNHVCNAGNESECGMCESSSCGHIEQLFYDCMNDNTCTKTEAEFEQEYFMCLDTYCSDVCDGGDSGDYCYDCWLEQCR